MMARLFSRWTMILFSVLVLIGAGARAHEGQTRVYVFGNSLVHHLSDSDLTTVPHWLALMSRAGEHDFALSGQWGFLRDFRRTLPPEPNWSFKEVRDAWNSERRGFSETGLTDVWVTPANFIQGVGVDAPFEGENPDNVSPLQVTHDVFDWVRSEVPEARLMVYEGWPEMGSVTRGFPPGDDALARYHDFAMGDYADWFDAYVEALSGRGQVELIPVSRVLSKVMTTTALSVLPAETFYSDDAPHGTAALYLMAAMVVYNSIYDEPVPEGFRPSSGVEPELRATFAMVRDAIWQEVQAFKASTDNTSSASVQEADVAEDPVAEVVPSDVAVAGDGVQVEYAEALSNPSLAMGLNGIADWSVQHPFLDLMKTARPWVGHKDGAWGAVSAEELEEGGFLNAQGWPVAFPPDVTALEAFILTDQPEAATHLAGRYVAFFEGSGKLTIGGRAKNVRQSEGQIAFDYAPGDGLVSIALSATDADDPIRNIRIVREDQRVMLEAGAVFNPLWLSKIENLRSVRFMDWMFTNGSKVSNWDSRAQVDDYTYVRRGAPLEVMIALANLVGADPWFNMPHMADDDYVTRFANQVKEDLREDLKAYAEYSNEVWNFVFPQAKYAQEEAKKRWGREAGDDAWMQYYGMRSAQIAQIWTEVFGEAAPERLVTVISTHTGWLGLETSALNAPLWVAEDRDNWEPYVFFNAYAITGYFGHEMGSEEGAPKVLEWIAQSRRAAESEAATRGLSGAERRAFIEENKYKAAHPAVAGALRDGSIKELVEYIFPTQARVAEDHGLALVMYEGGTHVAVSGEFSQNEELISYFKAFNYSEEMGNIYRDVLAAWKASNGTLFNAFVDVAKPSQYGNWGALRHLQDSNPRWDALMAFNAQTPAWWEARPETAFVGGRYVVGSAVGGDVTGSRGGDLLIGGDADDVFLPEAGRDRIIGGDGFDAALLPGEPSQYQFSRRDGRLVVRSETLEVDLQEVEMLWFEAEEDLAIMVEDLL